MYHTILPENLKEFFHVIDGCEREVELLTKDGFHLNLKSKLCQYVALTSIFCNKKRKECAIVTHAEKDTERILRFMVFEQHKNSW